MTQSKVDVSGVMAGLSSLSTDGMESLIRSMGVAGGQVLRDEAKARAPRKSGLLVSAIYLAYKESKSAVKRAVYSVTWNARKAPHGHLVEFGHWRYNKIINGRPQKSLRDGLKRGNGPQDHVPPGALETPEWIAAQSFLRPAYESASGRALKAMLARGRARLSELLAERGSE